MTVLWVGTYPAAGPDAPAGQGEGVWRLELEPRTGALSGRLAASTPAPSFLAVSPDRRTLFAAGETSPGSVTRLVVRPDGTVQVGERVGSGGVHPCHLLLHPELPVLYVANYSSGSLGVLPLRLGADGLELVGGVAQVFEHSGRGPVTGRQDGPHVHSSVLAPGGRNLLALDLGTDELRRYRVQPDGLLVVDGLAARLAPGTGPRHAAVLGRHLVVVGELSGTLHLLEWDDPRQVADEVDVLALPGAGDGRCLPAHVLVDGTGQVLVGVRGADVVVRVRVDGGRLVADGQVQVGAWPRHMALVGDRLVVAAQGGGRVHSTGWPPAAPPASGTAACVAAEAVEIPSPACVVPG